MTPAKTHGDVIIVGSSLAGCAAAAALAPTHARIVMLERAPTARMKPCGEGVTGAAITILEKLGFAKTIEQLPRGPVHHYEIHQGKRVASVPVSPRTTGIERQLLDAALLASLETNFKVQVLRGTTATSLALTDSGIIVSTLDGQRLSARFVILADGFKGALSRAWSDTQRTTRDRVGQSVHVECAAPHSIHSIQIYVRGKTELYVTPVSETRLNLAVLSDRKSARNIALELLAAECIPDLPHMTVIEPAKGAGTFDRVKRTSLHPRVFLAGDAAEVFDPIGGMGMVHAIGSGKLAGDCVGSALKAEVRDLALTPAALQYATAREQFARPLRRITALSTFAIKYLSNTPFLKLLAHFGMASALHDFYLSRAVRKICSPALQ